VKIQGDDKLRCGLYVQKLRSSTFYFVSRCALISPISYSVLYFLNVEKPC